MFTFALILSAASVVGMCWAANWTNAAYERGEISKGTAWKRAAIAGGLFLWALALVWMNWDI